MAVLSAAQRKKIPKSEFGLPDEREYPEEDWGHAADAKSRAKAALRRGHLSRAEYDKICAKANAVMAREKKQ